ncbi:MAG: hypothetical protein ISR55_03335 [Bacteroidetes bacterium]|nr:hypothetical protein [Bacteroidota bacterium]
MNKIFKIYLFSVGGLFLFFNLFSQDIPEGGVSKKGCFMHEMTQINKHRFVPTNSIYYRNYEAFNEDEYYIIPCVVHVIHDGGDENISDQKIKSQIDILNEDYGHYGVHNLDARGEDAKIRFCLASRDPDGVASTGINRIQSSFTDLDSEDEMATKNLSYWDPHKYLNLWIVKSIDNNPQLLGYSYRPTLSGGPDFNGDGIVLTYKYVGKTATGYNNLGRTATHESGHYFDLMHVWGGDDFAEGEGDCNDDDQIYDTPNCSTTFHSHPNNSCPHPRQCNNVRLIEDFMDYSYDACMKLFTPGQNERMRLIIQNYRSELVSYNNMIITGCEKIYDSLNSNSRVDIRTSPTQNKVIFKTHFSKGTSDLIFNLYDITGALLKKEIITGIGKQTIPYDLIELRPGIYIITGTFAGESFTHKLLMY